MKETQNLASNRHIEKKYFDHNCRISHRETTKKYKKSLIMIKFRFEKN